MRKRKLFNILHHAIIDKNLRESLFANDRKAVEGWDLTKVERAFLKNLPYEKFEQSVGGIFSHWLVPVTINNQYLIIPQTAGDVQPNGHIPIRLTESLVFGNGTHPTTALMLSALIVHLQPKTTVLDLGTGSGVLSIAAALLGADSVLALDIDPKSVETANKNIRLNGVEDTVRVKPGSLEEAKLAAAASGGFDLVLVNILTPVILSFLEDGLAKVLKPGATLTTSGIEVHENPFVRDAMHQAGLIDITSQEKQGWAIVTAHKPPKSNHKR